MTIASGSIIKGVCEVTHPVGALMLNVHYWQTSFSAPVAEDQVRTDLTAQMNSIYGRIDQLQKSTLTYDAFRFYNWTGLAWNLIGTSTPTQTPAATAEAVPSGCAVVVRAYTDVSRRLGRKFLGGFTEADFSGADWSTALQTAAATYATDWVSTYNPAAGRSYIPGVYYSTGGFQQFNGETVVNAIPGYQRRRKEGVGA